MTEQLAQITQASPVTQAAQAPARSVPPHPDSVAVFNAMSGHPDFQNERIYCMSGDQAAKKLSRTGAFKRPANAEVGEVCRMIMEESADTERNSAELKARSDKGLLAPYRAIAKDKGYSQSDGNAAAILSKYMQAMHTPANQKRSDPVRLPLENGQVLAMTPGVVLDASFTQTIRDALAGKPVPPAVWPEANLANIAEGCNYNNREIGSVENCRTAGQGLASVYLQRKGVVATR